jgi:cysteine rich repeat protein
MSQLKRVSVVVWVVIVGALLTCRIPALAADACQADAQKSCPGMKPGDAGYTGCMQQHAAQLSKPCAEHLQEAAARANELKEFSSCVADAEKLCPGTKPGGGQIMLCLRTHQGDLSSDCMQEMRDHGGLR